MRRFILFLFMGCLTVTSGRAQQGEPALARVIYEFMHINDTLQPDKPYKEEMVLYIGQHATSYDTYSLERVNQQIKSQMEDPAFDGNLTLRGSGSTTKESYYIQPEERRIKQLYRLAGEIYVVDEDYPAIDWQVADETKEIGGYDVQKATGRFRGRDYTAWFTTALPFQAGPWKLQGLPGLVLEASDHRGEVFFRYAGFETLKEGEATLSLPENAITTNKKALDKLKKGYQKNPQAAMNARSRAGASSSGGGATTVKFGGSSGNMDISDPSRIKSINVIRDDGQASPVTNNPIELE
ncbi:GLPGLI family protein [Parapedobacter indicus]|uniref:GLPGLI family protein n=1 Tax=Parapedobacter indicus TaxID=1477437 RepID=A0A1I3KGW7_9SPHI|nr:GLPGLI family protein [Parapedobacter indicus]PPL01815.1 GLPGLI family protein [Parapedobacter indicus]SFI71538.1 GLPGLI family protein [Parapedobacter indicus]